MGVMAAAVGVVGVAVGIVVGGVHVVDHRGGRVSLLLEGEGDDPRLVTGIGGLELALLLDLEARCVVGLEAGPEGGVVGDLVGVVGVVGVGGRAAGLTEEREVRGPGRVRRGQEGADEGDDHERPRSRCGRRCR